MSEEWMVTVGRHHVNYASLEDVMTAFNNRSGSLIWRGSSWKVWKFEDRKWILHCVLRISNEGHCSEIKV